jgi:transcription-repair coupling factor (superfamily II helicase)
MNNKKIIFVPDGAETLILKEALQKKEQLVCFVTSRPDKFEQIANSCQLWCPDMLPALEYPAWDCMPYDRISPSIKIMQSRLTTLTTLINNRPLGARLLLLQTQSLLQKTISPALLAKYSMQIEIGMQITPENLKRFLVDVGYSYSDTANFSGEFAVRGGIVDIVSEVNSGYRIDFFGNQIESIRVFNPETQISSGNIKQFCLLPVNEVILNKENIDFFKENYRFEFGIDTKDELYEAISHGRHYAGIVHWLPLFYQQLSSLTDYLPENTIFYTDHYFEEALAEFHKEVNDYYQSRISASKSDYKALPPESLYSSVASIKNKLEKFNLNVLSPYAVPEVYKLGDKLDVEAKLQKLPLINVLQQYVAKTAQHKKVIITYSSNSGKEQIINLFENEDIPCQEIRDGNEISSLPKGVFGLMPWALPQGVVTNEYVFISEFDLWGDKPKKRSNKQKQRKAFNYDLFNLQPNELVVHKEHGIGKFLGLEALEIKGVSHDFIKLLYFDDDKFYLPVENFELISKFGGDLDNVRLDKLGHTAWQARKARLQNRIKIAAEALLAIAAERSLLQAPILGLSPIYQEFCHRFPYSETEDQLAAIEDVSNDLLSGKPMDRLVCGDVGFGKTEVALRAACQVAAGDNPYQVAVIVPSTLLARQHMQTFSERFAGLPIKLGQLSRFVNAAEQKQVKLGLKEGVVDIVIGTHALLAKDIEFKRLGLIIIDEEQHFGVAQKEKLKKLKSGCHILTLSATPIPRTLQMSLAGIKELSLITTPPLDRLPVKTNVLPYDSVIVREAIMREYARGGRVFYVTPRIEYMDNILQQLRELVPEIRVKTISGKTPPAELDKVMYDFYLGKFDLLLSTNIVESGLDIPSANTIIIDRAHLFGLAQLYQMRGRVGRSKLRAYAYLLLPPGLRLTDDAKKRLDVISSIDRLGGGFSIAGHDMDIRGYGNLVGEEQSGHIKEVGVELYQQMLNDAVANLQQQEEALALNNADDWSPAINLGISIQIPESYIADINLRLQLYRQIASLANQEEITQQKLEMLDRFGKLPDSIEHLLQVIQIKCLAKQIGIAKIERGEKGILFTFREKNNINAAEFMKFVQARANFMKLRPDNKLLIIQEWSTAQQVLKGVLKLLGNLGGWM